MSQQAELSRLRRLLELASRRLRAGAVREIQLERQVRDMRRQIYTLETELHLSWALGHRAA